MKGADQCPRCGCRRTADGELPAEHAGFYGPTIRVCANCSTAWEPFDEADLLDEGERLSSFKTPCDNCAFRKGSPEQRDPEKWQSLRDAVGYGTGRFYCHKGVPIDPENGVGFAYPKDGKDPKKLRLCRGYLNQLKFPEPASGDHDPLPADQPWEDPVDP